MTNIPALRKDIRKAFPQLKFRLHTVSFSDLARGSKVFVESDAWGMTRGNQALYHEVEKIAKKHGAIASW